MITTTKSLQLELLNQYYSTNTDDEKTFEHTPESSSKDPLNLEQKQNQKQNKNNTEITQNKEEFKKLPNNQKKNTSQEIKNYELVKSEPILKDFDLDLIMKHFKLQNKENDRIEEEFEVTLTEKATKRGSLRLLKNLNDDQSEFFKYTDLYDIILHGFFLVLVDFGD